MMTISLLIPVFDYDIVALVHSMKSCMGELADFREILIGDDGSSPEYRLKYKSLEDENVRVIVSDKNIGRAAIRNKLALEAKGDYLLFIDADTMIPSTAEAFIKNWLKIPAKTKVACGGILYHESPPGDPDKILRWKYGRKKEQIKASDRAKRPYSSFSTFNVLIEKSIFSILRFNEELRQYGHEDTLLSYQLRKAGIEIYHIDNPLYHEGLESNREYISKTRFGIENLSKLYDSVTDKQAFAASVRMLRFYHNLQLFSIAPILAYLFINSRDRMEIKLDSAKPSLLLFSLYKISLFCTYRAIHMRRTIIPVF
jgi:glycosyltransferase involved in cell wall biosynthesis